MRDPLVIKPIFGQVTNLTFNTLQEGWEGINEFLATFERQILANNGSLYGTEIMVHDLYMKMLNPHIDPYLNLGKVLGYNIRKWTSLVNNYVDMHYLELCKNEIQLREAKKARSYTYSLHFSNSHGSGKDCLVSLVFSRRSNVDVPVVTFNIRISEVTKRLIFDFLLVKRICDYIYGEDSKYEVRLFAPSAYITAESFCMYNNHKSIKKIMKPYRDNPAKFQKKILETYDYFTTVDPKTVTFKVNQRAVLQFQRGEDGLPKSGVEDLFVKDLRLFQHSYDYPDDVISPADQRRYKKENGIESKPKKVEKEPGQRRVGRPPASTKKVAPLQVNPDGTPKRGRGRPRKNPLPEPMGPVVETPKPKEASISKKKKKKKKLKSRA
jgi:hypothetical protein